MQYSLVIPPEIGAGITAIIAAALAAIAAWLKANGSKSDKSEQKPGASLDDVVRLLTEISDRQERQGETLIRIEDRTRGHHS